MSCLWDFVNFICLRRAYASFVGNGVNTFLSPMKMLCHNDVTPIFLIMNTNFMAKKIHSFFPVTLQFHQNASNDL